MSTKLSARSLERAIDHMARYGDTDVFPTLLEVVFLHQEKAKVVDELSKYDLNSYTPRQGIETIAPKSRLGFRVVHQLHYLDALLFNSTCIEAGKGLENLKQPLGSLGPFGYRFDDNGDESLFLDSRSYKDWLELQIQTIDQGAYENVLCTDIADFYSRIYLHRIENTLDVALSDKGLKRAIEKFIKTVRSRQSHGIPVGGSASRLIAEAILADSDAALLQEGYDFTRYVDDFRIYMKHGQDPYAALSFLAEQLSVSEGLTLNAQKTRIVSASDYVESIRQLTVDHAQAAEDHAANFLGMDLYFDEEPDQELVDWLKSVNLIEALETEAQRDVWDYTKIRGIFRAMRVAPNAEMAPQILENIDTYMPFAKEIVILFDEIVRSGINMPSSAAPIVVDKIRSGSAASVPTLRAWLLELAVREIIPIDYTALSSFRNETVLDRRQVYLIHGVNKNVNFFRRQKTRLEEKGELEKGAFLLGATCLPPDELDAWVSAIKPSMTRPLDGLFCDWLKKQSGKLTSLIELRSGLARE